MKLYIVWQGREVRFSVTSDVCAMRRGTYFVQDRNRLTCISGIGNAGI
jgi:hypothetical protein